MGEIRSFCGKGDAEKRLPEKGERNRGRSIGKDPRAKTASTLMGITLSNQAMLNRTIRC